MAQLTYRPDVDGLRAISILAVLLFHAKLGCPGGFVGVDIFFVISGYLISGIIRRDLETGNFTFAGFWERRIRRIMPALSVMVLCTLIVGWFLLLPADFASLAKSAIMQSVLSANFHFLGDSGYFAGRSELKPLLHTWSLAVEEQFYLFFPFLLYLFRKASQKRSAILYAIIAASSFILSVWGTYRFADATFYLLPTRAWELLLGTMVGFAPRLKADHIARPACAWIGLVLILVPIFTYSDTTRFPGLAALPPCLGAALIIWSHENAKTAVSSLLSWKPLVFIGLISYSLYLWHWPIFAYLRYVHGGNAPMATQAIASVASILIAVVSWRWIETPLRRKSMIPRRSLFVGAGVVTMLIAGITACVLGTKGIPARFPREVLALLEYNEIPTRYREDGMIPVGAPLQAGSNPDFLVWGDSHAQALGFLIDEEAKENHLSGILATRGATAPLPGAWRPNKGKKSVDWNEKVLSAIVDQKIPRVIIISRWAVNIEGRPEGGMQSLVVDEHSHRLSPAESAQVMRRSLNQVMDKLLPLGTRVSLVGQVPEQSEEVPLLLARMKLYQPYMMPTGTPKALYDLRQKEVVRILGELREKGASIIDPSPWCFDKDGRSIITGHGRSYYYDDNHVSTHGARELMRPVVERFLLGNGTP